MFILSVTLCYQKYLSLKPQATFSNDSLISHTSASWTLAAKQTDSPYCLEQPTVRPRTSLYDDDDDDHVFIVDSKSLEGRRHDKWLSWIDLRVLWTCLLSQILYQSWVILLYLTKMLTHIYPAILRGKRYSSEIAISELRLNEFSIFFSEASTLF